MTKVSKKVFWNFLNSLPVSAEGCLTFCGNYKDGRQKTVYFHLEIPIGEMLASVGRRTQYFINLDIRKDLENEQEP